MAFWICGGEGTKELGNATKTQRSLIVGWCVCVTDDGVENMLNMK